MIEHITFEQSAQMLAECHRVLKPGGRIRIATPPLRFIVNLLTNPSGPHEAYIAWHAQTWRQGGSEVTPAVVANDYFHMWGHKFLYDETTLRSLMEHAGFRDVATHEPLASPTPHLQNLECVDRLPPGMYELVTFILEGTKP
jgi:predicted SAM-dependent methyltransferase